MTPIYDEFSLYFSDPQNLSIQRLMARYRFADGWAIAEKFSDRFDTEVGGFSHIAQQWLDEHSHLHGDWKRNAAGEVATVRRPSVIVDYDNGAKRYTEAEADGILELSSVLVRLREREAAYVSYMAEKDAARARLEKRKRLYQTELKARRVRFLPAQVMRPIYARAAS